MGLDRVPLPEGLFPRKLSSRGPTKSQSPASIHPAGPILVGEARCKASHQKRYLKQIPRIEWTNQPSPSTPKEAKIASDSRRPNSEPNAQAPMSIAARTTGVPPVRPACGRSAFTTPLSAVVMVNIRGAGRMKRANNQCRMMCDISGETMMRKDWASDGRP